MDIFKNIEFRDLMRIIIFAEIIVYSVFLFIWASSASFKAIFMHLKKNGKFDLEIKLICLEYFALLTISSIFIRGFNWISVAFYAFICLFVVQLIRFFIFHSNSRIAVKLLTYIKKNDGIS
jgi:hypothetical protein